MILLRLHQSFSLDKSHEPSMRFVFNKTTTHTHTLLNLEELHIANKKHHKITLSNTYISDHQPSFACHPRRPFRMIKRKIGFVTAPISPGGDRRLFSFVVPVINYGFIGVEGETKPTRPPRGREKNFARGPRGAGEKGVRLIIVRRHCSAALLNWQKEISWPPPPPPPLPRRSCIGKPMMSKGIRPSLIETSKHIKNASARGPGVGWNSPHRTKEKSAQNNIRGAHSIYDKRYVSYYTYIRN